MDHEDQSLPRSFHTLHSTHNFTLAGFSVFPT